MKKLAFTLAFLATPAFAQQAPSADEIAAIYYSETGQLRLQLGQAQREIIALKKQVEAAKAVPVVSPAPDKK